MEGWNWKGKGGAGTAGESGGEGANGSRWGYDGRRENDWGEWQQWDGEWWIRVGLFQRRRVSRNLRRLIAREQNEVLKLLRELKSALWKGNEFAETCDRVTQGGGSSDGETERNKGDDDDDDGVGSRGGSSWEKVRVEKRGGS